MKHPDTMAISFQFEIQLIEAERSEPCDAVREQRIDNNDGIRELIVVELAYG